MHKHVTKSTVVDFDSEFIIFDYKFNHDEYSVFAHDSFSIWLESKIQYIAHLKIKAKARK